MTKLLPETDPRENPVLEFDFDGDLESITTVVLNVTPSGVDLLDGAHQVVGAIVYQRIKRGVALANTNYHIDCEATDGVNYRVRAAIIPMRAA
jgi:hypothetical protein